MKLRTIITLLLGASLCVGVQTVAANDGNWYTRLTAIDTTYIEPQHFNYTVMLQNTNSYEVYTIKSKTGQAITFSPDATVRIGPYVGWQWVFLGYTFDLSALTNTKHKTEVDLSLYSSICNIDLYYRKTKGGYSISSGYFADNEGEGVLDGTAFPGLSVSIRGVDLYYVFNNKRFSYPAAFSQSTVQRRSCGSPLIGIGVMAHDINLNTDQLKEVVEEKMTAAGITTPLDTAMMENEVHYTAYSASVVYAYNWVIARNWLFASSLSLALAYKVADGEVAPSMTDFMLRDFHFNNLNVDVVGRFGLVWNNTRWYAGTSAILHSYNYRKSRFSTNNMFWSLNVYMGVNVGRKKK